MIAFRLLAPVSDDPRLVMSRVEMVAQSVASTAAGAPAWVIVLAFLTTGTVGYFGAVSPLRAIISIVLVSVVAVVARLVLRQFVYDQVRTSDLPTAVKWHRRVLAMTVSLSTAWGVVPWLLWQPGLLANHILVSLTCLAIVSRFLVSRSGYTEFFVASFFPMMLLLFTRLATEGDPANWILAALIPLYGTHLAMDARHFNNRVHANLQLRFANEDMARELEEARDEALRKRAEAEAANVSKTAFLANMSHELRTPLNAILGFSEIIARECLGPVGSPRYREYASDIHSSGAHLLSLINDLLDIAKIESGRMEIQPCMIETRHMLEHALKLVTVRAQERCQNLSVSVAPDAQVVFADERAIKQIVINLVANAVKFTQEGGNIRIAAARDAHGNFELTVTDDGPGIAQEKIDQIFRPFSQIDNRYDRRRDGTGLGLALVRGLSEMHGGKAWIESIPGKGTRAYVVLPAPDNGARVRAMA